ncbi:hypothetical protein F2P79_011883 [Pimephales promelas]|nr:hypothetical protein F2P79_011883 [Pimephales promelas]
MRSANRSRRLERHTVSIYARFEQITPNQITASQPCYKKQAVEPSSLFTVNDTHTTNCSDKTQISASGSKRTE